MRRIGGATRIGAVIGWPVAHSASPALHNAAFAALDLDAAFVALPVEPSGLTAAVHGLRALGFMGVSVTIPHKEAVVPLCDAIEPGAQRIGAVNCLVLGAEGVTGHNTDAGGFLDALAELGASARDARCVLLGAGGAARAVAMALAEAGAAEVDVVARNPSSARWCAARPWTDAELAELIPRCDVLVDCTPVGLGKGAGFPAEVAIDRLPDRAAVCALAYGAPGSALLEPARARGLRAMDGGAMLVHQGARALRLWTGLEPPVEVMRAALAAR